MEKCFDEGVIQAFLDGELASDLSEKVACHVATCDACAVSLATAEEESSFAFAALDIEFNTLVPTERIRTRLFETIAAERKSFWQKIFGEGFRWTNPSVAAFASLILVVGLFATLWIARENSAGENQIAANNQPQTTVAKTSPAKVENEIPAVNPAVPFVEDERQAPQIRQINAKPKNENKFEVQKAVYKPAEEDRTPFVRTEPQPREAIAGEESYLKTIATLQQDVENRKDQLLKPSLRVAFEKDMAVVDYAIKKMKTEVRRNPKNEAAREVLRSSYQNKIDLLNSVTEKSDLMAIVDKK
jgi:hypothetical protein